MFDPIVDSLYFWIGADILLLGFGIFAVLNAWQIVEEHRKSLDDPDK